MAAGPVVAPPGLVELGAVRGAYGVKGWLKVAPFDNDALVLRSARQWWVRNRMEGWQDVEVSAVRRHGGVLLAKWRGVETPEAADAVTGAIVAVPRSAFPALPVGESYWVDLVGAQVVNREGTVLGRVSAVRTNGVHELIDVSGAAKSHLIPLVPAYVDEVDVAGRSIRVDWRVDWS